MNNQTNNHLHSNFGKFKLQICVPNVNDQIIPYYALNIRGVFWNSHTRYRNSTWNSAASERGLLFSF